VRYQEHPDPSGGATGLRSPLAMFQVVLITVCALLSVAPTNQLPAMVLLLPLSLGCWAAYRSPSFARGWPLAGTLLASAGVPWSGGSGSPLLPYLLTAGLAVGLTSGLRELALTESSALGVLLLGALLHDSPHPGQDVVAGAEWVLLSLAVGLVGIWARRLAVHETPDAYLEARKLLEQLRGLTRQLPAGFDATSAAEGLLQRCWQAAPHQRAAVIVEPHAGVFVPLAVTGARRVPWRTPHDEDGPLQRAWTTGLPVVDRRQPDTGGRRSGSTLVALPLLGSEGAFGLVIVESYDPTAFAEVDVEALKAAVEQASPQLETAVLFEEVRREASAEERDRLARDMHDGIAQELAYLGYQLDDLRQRAGAFDTALADQVAEVRRGLTALVTDLRLSITELRTSTKPSQGLGATLSTYLRAVCTNRGLVLTISLNESAFRLPAEVEVVLFKVAQAYAQEMSRAVDATSLSVRLIVDPPSAMLTLSGDSLLARPRLDDLTPLLDKLGATVSWHDTGLHIRIEGETHDDHGAAGGRPRADQAGAPARVRAH
jgi:signal transduction histidine kinase